MKHKGIPVCGGMASACGYWVEPAPAATSDKRAADPPRERLLALTSLTEALSQQMEDSVKALRDAGKETQAQMLELQKTMLGDSMFQKSIRRHIEEGLALDSAIVRAAEEQSAMLRATGDSLLMERVADVEDISSRMICHLAGRPYPSLSGLVQPVIVAGKNLNPSMLVDIQDDMVQGLVLEEGSATSHIAVLAGNLGIPTIVGCRGLEGLREALARQPDLQIYLDAQAGEVHYQLSNAEWSSIRTRINSYREEHRALEQFCRRECATAHGKRILLLGNITDCNGVDRLERFGADGVGLFRTEFLYMNRSTLPTEDEQFAIYKTAASKLAGKPLTIRTLDIGADKPAEALGLAAEDNPFLGFRAIRICLQQPELLKTQLRAILRASAYGNVRVMFPMIATESELDAALALLEEAKAEVWRRGEAYNRHLPVGLMVEVPSAAILARKLIKKVDFFSIGSNDLTQYILAVDRMNPQVQYLYNGLDPAVLELMRMAVDACHDAGKSCSICGELAADGEAIPVLLEMGLEALSVSPSHILSVKRLVASFDGIKQQASL